jgi:hypothetical protein
MSAAYGATVPVPTFPIPTISNPCFKIKVGMAAISLFMKWMFNFTFFALLQFDNSSSFQSVYVSL